MKANAYYTSDVLKPYIKSYNFVDIDNSVDKHPTQFLLPGGSFEIIFMLGGKIDQLSSHMGSWMLIPKTSLGGLFDVHYRFKPVGRCRFLRIQFNPGKTRFMNLGNLKNFQNQMVEIEHFSSLIRADCFDEIQSTENRKIAVDSLNQYFESKLTQLNPIEDDKILLAIKTIQETKGLIRINELAADLKISISNFRKKFKQHVGISPKKFARTQRIHHIAKQIDQNHQVNLTALAHDMNYFDQSHFIKDVRNVCGVAPSMLCRDEFHLQRVLASA